MTTASAPLRQTPPARTRTQNEVAAAAKYLKRLAAEQRDDGISGDPLTDEGAAAIQMLIASMQAMDEDEYSQSQSPHVARVMSAVRLLWGTQGTTAIHPQADDENTVGEQPTGETTVDQPGYFGMSLEQREQRDIDKAVEAQLRRAGRLHR